ncbi:MAG: hypothetical protein MO846_12250 [Candidatus Devosia symbiotica]|nr:hypothetical protein [Candidatus Devosia symbiotica]
MKFTSVGHVGFEVEYHNQVASFIVDDSGSGIGPGDIEHVFEPFVRGQPLRVRPWLKPDHYQAADRNAGRKNYPDPTHWGRSARGFRRD